jgi:hypothetical protein
VAIGLVPLSLLPEDLAVFLVFVASVAALMGAAAVVGVRDIRCFAAILLWAPAWNSLDTLNISSALALGVALVWRFRSRVWHLAATLGVMVSVKLFLWPLLAWVALTRRATSALVGLGVGLLVTLVSWALIGFDGLADYPALLARVDEQENYAIASLVGGFGPDWSGRLLAAVAGVALLVLAVRLWRRGEEERAFALAVAACLAFSPVVWLHYLTLLIAPLGLLRPRFSLLWLLPIVLWMSPRDENGDGLQPYVPLLVVAALILIAIVHPRRAVTAEGAS